MFVICSSRRSDACPQPRQNASESGCMLDARLAIMWFLVFFLFAVPTLADPGFDEKYERDYNIFNPANQYRPDNPLNPADRFDPNNPFNPVNRFDPNNPVNPSNRYNPSNPFNPANQYNPDNPLNPANRYDPETPFNPLP